MSNNPPPVPPRESRTPEASASQGAETNIVDMREAFRRKDPPSAEELAAAKAFIDGKIEMVRRDPHLSEAEKAVAIADLEARKINASEEPKR